MYSTTAAESFALTSGVGNFHRPGFELHDSSLKVTFKLSIMNLVKENRPSQTSPQNSHAKEMKRMDGQQRAPGIESLDEEG